MKWKIWNSVRSHALSGGLLLGEASLTPVNNNKHQDKPSEVTTQREGANFCPEQEFSVDLKHLQPAPEGNEWSQVSVRKPCYFYLIILIRAGD